VPEDDRWLLIAKDTEGFTLADLSRLTGLNENAVKIRLLRIRRDLVAAAAGSVRTKAIRLETLQES
jgi:DNA-directed RNA polymerase specialized sigma24 family protein